jgi:hypothetical protein
MTMAARDKRDAADRKRSEWLDAEREADEALRAIEHELDLDQIEAATERTARSQIAG